MYARLPIFANSARYFVEPLAFGGLVVAVLLLAARGRDFSDILPNLGVMALAGYRLLPSLQLLYAQLTQVSSMRHAVNEVYDEFVAAETEKSIPRVTKHRTCHTCESVPLEQRNYTVRSPLSLSRRIAPSSGWAFCGDSQEHFTGVIGPTGSGKSTFVDLLLGLYYPTAGEILIDGQPLTPALVPSWRDSIGYVPQDIFLIDDTIARNIAFGLPDEKIDQTRLREACAMAQILGFVEADLRDGFRHKCWASAVSPFRRTNASALVLARADLPSAIAVDSDEATSALDVATEAKAARGVAQSSASSRWSWPLTASAPCSNCDQLVDLGREGRRRESNYGLR